MCGILHLSVYCVMLRTVWERKDLSLQAYLFGAYAIIFSSLLCRTYTHAHTRNNTFTHSHVQMHAHTRAHTHTHIHTHKRTHTCLLYRARVAGMGLCRPGVELRARMHGLYFPVRVAPVQQVGT